MIRRRAFLIASAISLVLCVGSAGLWVWGRTDDQHHLPIGNPIRLLSFGDGNPIRVLCFGDGKVTCMVRSEASLESHPDLTGDTFIEAAGFVYWRDSRYGGRTWSVSVPLWFLVSVTAVLPVVWMLKRKPRLPGLCPACGYDLRATPLRCPECGRVSTEGIGG